MERAIGREMRAVEMAGSEENLEGVGVVERFCCSLLVFVVSVVVVVVVVAGGQPMESERLRLKYFRGERMLFFVVVFVGEGSRSWSGEGWTRVEVGLPLIVFGEVVVLGCVC